MYYLVIKEDGKEYVCSYGLKSEEAVKEYYEKYFKRRVDKRAVAIIRHEVRVL